MRRGFAGTRARNGLGSASLTIFFELNLVEWHDMDTCLKRRRCILRCQSSDYSFLSRDLE